MSDWPDSLKVAPIREWPGELTPANKRQPPRFKATLKATTELLGREIWNLCDTRAQRDSASLLIAIPAGASQWRNDGRPRAQAIADHPGVIFSIESKHGQLSYPCDTFTTWQSNLRAIALALEALRLVDRYGVTRHGEQYRGFLAIESGHAATAGFSQAQDAQMFLAGVTGMRYADHPPRNLVAAAKRMTHPDRGGDADVFSRVMLAEAKLRQEGLIS